MTGLHDTSPDRDANAREFHREQLSAMLDGALSADETRFLLRRMQHDDELADCWGRWQFYGDALRGHAGRALPADFSQRVGRAIADDITVAEAEPVAVSAEARRPMASGSLLQRPLLRWGGGAALAASVALAAFLGGREPAAVPTEPVPSTAAVIDPAGAQPGAPVPMGAMPTASLPVPQPEAPAADPTAPAAVLVASAAAAAAAAESRGAHPRIKAASRAATIERDRLAAHATASASPPEQAAPSFAVRTPEAGDLSSSTVAKPIVAKPWPRALVPGAAGNDTVTAGLDDDSQGLHPVFQPRPQPRFELPPPASSVATPP
jgi:negative regulator of sigma E activity